MSIRELKRRSFYISLEYKKNWKILKMVLKKKNIAEDTFQGMTVHGSEVLPWDTVTSPPRRSISLVRMQIQYKNSYFMFCNTTKKSKLTRQLAVYRPKYMARLVPSYKFYSSSISQIWRRRCQVDVHITFGHILANIENHTF